MNMATKTQASALASTSAVQTNRKLPRATKPIDTWILMVIFLFTVNIQSDLNGRSMVPICEAGPVPTSLVLPPSSVDSPSIQVVNLTRQHGGDIFTAFGKFENCFHSISIIIFIICGTFSCV